MGHAAVPAWLSLVRTFSCLVRLGNALPSTVEHSSIKLLRTWSSKCASVAMLYTTVPKWDTLSQAPLSSTGFSSLVSLGHTLCSVV